MRSTERSLGGGAILLLREWWPAAAFLAPVLVVQAVWSAQYEAAGHAAGHLGSATAIFPMVFVSAVLLWVLPGGGRGDPLLWLLVAAAIGSCLVVMVGNVRVVDAIGDDDWTDAQASALGPSRPGFESGHDLAMMGAGGSVLATMLIAVLLWRRGLVSAYVAGAAAALSLLFPYWIFPGFGILVLAISAVVARSRRLRDARGSGLGGMMLTSA
jgi:hypothetical protein